MKLKHFLIHLSILERSTVLYINSIDYSNCKKIIEKIINETKIKLFSNTPAFTKKIANGIGLAEEPSNGLSFGENICRALAQIIILNINSSKAEVKINSLIKKAFNEQNIDINHPYLQQGKKFKDYDVMQVKIKHANQIIIKESSIIPTNTLLLEEIKNYIISTAKINEGLATWLVINDITKYDIQKITALDYNIYK